MKSSECSDSFLFVFPVRINVNLAACFDISQNRKPSSLCPKCTFEGACAKVSLTQLVKNLLCCEILF